MQLVTYIFVFPLLLIAFKLSTGTAQLSFSSCPPVSVISDFNLSQYMGTWYVNRMSFEILEIASKCSLDSYEQTGDNTISATYNATMIITGRKISAKQTGVLMDPTVGKLGITFPISFLPKNLPYWILDTDYTSYTVVWSCGSVGIANLKVIWLMTRERIPSDSSAVDKALAVLKSNGLDNISLRLVDQSNC